MIKLGEFEMLTPEIWMDKVYTPPIVTDDFPSLVMKAHWNMPVLDFTERMLAIGKDKPSTLMSSTEGKLSGVEDTDIWFW